MSNFKFKLFFKTLIGQISEQHRLFSSPESFYTKIVYFQYESTERIFYLKIHGKYRQSVKVNSSAQCPTTLFMADMAIQGVKQKAVVGNGTAVSVPTTWVYKVLNPKLLVNKATHHP
jgi:hypothetical protein